MSVKQRFWAKCTFEPNTGCWPWTASINNKGYGELMLRHTRRTEYAHRISFFLAYGLVPAEARHTCDTPCCVNPEHVVDGTHLDNMQDMVMRGRSRLGTSCPQIQKITDDEVHAIRIDLRSGAAVGRDYGITRQYVSQLRRGLCRV